MMDPPEIPAREIAPLQKSRKSKKRGRPPRATAMPHARSKHKNAFQWLERSPASETADVSPAASLSPVEKKSETMQNGDDNMAMSGVSAGILSPETGDLAPIPPECLLPEMSTQTEQNPYALAISSLDRPFGLVPAPAMDRPSGRLRRPALMFTQTVPYLYELGPNWSENRFMDSVSELFPAPAMSTQTMPNLQEQSPNWSENSLMNNSSESLPNEVPTNLPRCTVQLQY